MRKQSIPGPLFKEERPGIEASLQHACMHVILNVRYILKSAKTTNIYTLKIYPLYGIISEKISVLREIYGKISDSFAHVQAVSSRS